MGISDMEGEKRIRLVVADDEYLIAQDVARAAREVGLEVVGQAANGERALELARELRPDAVIMDIRMPQMDGLEAARRLAEEAPTPVVILTAHETRDFLNEAKAAGIGAYLVKPPNAQELLRAVEIAMARHADLMELRRVNSELKGALERVKKLEGILPICSSCKKIRDDTGYWAEVEEYFALYSDLMFSHGLCNGCLQKLYPDFVDDD